MGYNKSLGRHVTAIDRLRIGHTRLTYSYLLSGDDQPTCSTCGHPLTVRHVLLDCVVLIYKMSDEDTSLTSRSGATEKNRHTTEGTVEVYRSAPRPDISRGTSGKSCDNTVWPAETYFTKVLTIVQILILLMRFDIIIYISSDFLTLSFLLSPFMMFILKRRYFVHALLITKLYLFIYLVKSYHRLKAYALRLTLSFFCCFPFVLVFYTLKHSKAFYVLVCR